MYPHSGGISSALCPIADLLSETSVSDCALLDTADTNTAFASIFTNSSRWKIFKICSEEKKESILICMRVFRQLASALANALAVFTRRLFRDSIKEKCTPCKSFHCLCYLSTLLPRTRVGLVQFIDPSNLVQTGCSLWSHYSWLLLILTNELSLQIQAGTL